MEKEIHENIYKSGYISENVIDIVCSLLIYHFFGFQVAIIVVLASIMADVATIMKRLYER